VLGIQDRLLKVKEVLKLKLLTYKNFNPKLAIDGSGNFGFKSLFLAHANISHISKDRNWK
jgi:hypothetical protein